MTKGWLLNISRFRTLYGPKAFRSCVLAKVAIANQSSHPKPRFRDVSRDQIRMTMADKDQINNIMSSTMTPHLCSPSNDEKSISRVAVYKTRFYSMMVIQKLQQVRNFKRSEGMYVLPCTSTTAIVDRLLHNSLPYVAPHSMIGNYLSI